MGGVENFIEIREIIEEGRQVPLCQRMQRQSGLIQHQNCVLVFSLAFHQEDEIKAQEPLNPGASALQLNFLRTTIIGNPYPEVAPIRFEAEFVISLFPPVPEFFCEDGAGGLEQYGAFPLF